MFFLALSYMVVKILFIDCVQACPEGFGQGFIDNLLPIVRIKGHGNIVHLPAVDVVGNVVTFTVGWDGLVEAERIVKGDKGLFLLVGPNMFEFTLLGANGVAKPMSARPAVWNLFVALGEEVVDGPPAAAQPVVADMFVGELSMLYFFVLPS